MLRYSSVDVDKRKLVQLAQRFIRSVFLMTSARKHVNTSTHFAIGIGAAPRSGGGRRVARGVERIARPRASGIAKIKKMS